MCLSTIEGCCLLYKLSVYFFVIRVKSVSAKSTSFLLCQIMKSVCLLKQENTRAVYTYNLEV